MQSRKLSWILNVLELFKWICLVNLHMFIHISSLNMHSTKRSKHCIHLLEHLRRLIAVRVVCKP